MTRHQYRAAARKLGLSLGALARLLRASEATGKRWSKLGPNTQGALLVRLLLAGKITPEDIEEMK